MEMTVKMSPKKGICAVSMSLLLIQLGEIVQCWLIFLELNPTRLYII